MLKKLGFQRLQLVNRLVVLLIIATAILLTALTTAAAATPLSATVLTATVYRDPACSCCGGWIEHLSSQGFQPTSISTSDMSTFKQQHGVPDSLSSCHTALIEGYLVEGHVPVDDIRRLLIERPEIAGIAVPGMPVGTPGMESGDVRDDFTVFAFDHQGNASVFNRYAF